LVRLVTREEIKVCNCIFEIEIERRDEESEKMSPRSSAERTSQGYTMKCVKEWRQKQEQVTKTCDVKCCES
jgi:hypothetical protein